MTLGPPVSANVANLFVGEQRIVEGRVLRAESENNTVRLRFGNGARDFTVSLLIPLLSNFPDDPTRAYVGRTVRVVGIIRQFRGAPEIIVRDAQDIQVVEELTPASAVVVPAKDTAPALHHQMEVLGEKLQRLDDRLRALEGGAPSGGVENPGGE